MTFQVENRVLKQAVKRKKQRFPEDFMFQLTKNEWKELITICDNLPDGVQYSPATPFAFTEQGVAMLSSVLNSDRAVAVNIQIMRVFTKIRQMLTDNDGLKLEIEKIKRKLDSQDKNTELIFQYLDELNDKIKRPPLLPDRERVGYKIKGKD